MPLSFPVAPSLSASFAYTLQELRADGQQAQIDKDERERLTAVTGSACNGYNENTIEDISSLQLPLASMAGTFIIAFFIQMFAIILSIAEYTSGRPVQCWFHAYDHITDQLTGAKNRTKTGHCAAYMRFLDSHNIPKGTFWPCYIVLTLTQQLHYYSSEKAAQGKGLPKGMLQCKGMEVKDEHTDTILDKLVYVLAVALPDSDIFGDEGSNTLELACKSEEAREHLKHTIVKLSEERDQSALSQYDFKKEMTCRFGSLPIEKEDQDQRAAQVMQQQAGNPPQVLRSLRLARILTYADVCGWGGLCLGG
jgi:hypothetical protein